MTTKPNPHAEELAVLLASPVPRSPTARQRSLARAEGGSLIPVMLGFVFSTGIAVFLLLNFRPIRPVDDWRLSRGPVATCAGRISSIYQTNFRENATYVYALNFDYEPTTGHPLQGSAFATGRKWSEGDTVIVHYLPNAPEVAAPVGARVSKIGTLFLPLLGVAPLLFGCFSAYLMRRRAAYEGVLVQGNVLEVSVEQVKSALFAPGASLFSRRRATGVAILKTDAGTEAVACYTLKAYLRAKQAEKSGEKFLILKSASEPSLVLFAEWVLE